MVTAASEPISTHGSGQAAEKSQRRAPSGVYGYGVASSSRSTTWSGTAIEWYPSSSAARARTGRWSTGWNAVLIEKRTGPP